MKMSSFTLTRAIIIASITFSATCFAGFESGSSNDRFGYICPRDIDFCQHQPPLPLEDKDIFWGSTCIDVAEC